MPRGRHRHSPPLHRMLPPSAIAGVSAVCALGPWVFTQPMVLRVLAAAAAVTAIAGAVVMRYWDTQAGKRVADLTRARASDEWRFEERVAELESDLEESRELRTKLEQRLRARRAELAGLRNEHAALLRRYAASEVDRASVLEERRVLEIEATVPDRALAAGPSVASDDAAGPQRAAGAVGRDGAAAGEEPAAPPVFSPEGSELFLRAGAALARLADDSGAAEDSGVPEDGAGPAARAGEAPGPAGEDTRTGDAPKGEDASEGPEDDGPEPTRKPGPEQAREDGTEGRTGAVGEHGRTTASPGPAAPADRSARQSSGHFAVPTAVAVAPPTAPARQPVSEGGFDFFGTKKETDGAALDAVQNEDLADVVGQEALALHKAESEERSESADEEARGVGRVIDLTAHDETEHIDVEGLRSAAS
ncbi:hypothetical protein ABTY20_15015 [Streptomyces sp. NPDC126497]|uniref:hypothetical protein n=1 Tax=Streptomyces sp. NPDC126497 TaxID=3155313 RepID=UPI00331B9CAE